MKRSISTNIILLSIVLIFTTAFSVGYIFYSGSHERLVKGELEELSDVSLLEGVRLIYNIQSLRDDVLVLASLSSVHDLIKTHSNDGSKEDKAQRRDKANMAYSDYVGSFLKHKHDYLEVSFMEIWDGGHEVTRIHRGERSGELFKSRDEKLTNESAYYLGSSMRLPKGEVYLTEIHILRNSGESNNLVPVMQAATPVINQHGEIAGVITITMDFSLPLDLFSESTNPDYTLYVTNDSGDFIIHPDEAMTFGIDRGDRHLIQQQIPELKAVYDAPYKEDEWFLVPEVESNNVIHFRKIIYDPNHLDRYIGIIHTVPFSTITADSSNARDNSIALAVILIMVGIVFSYLLSNFMVQPLRVITLAAQGYAQGVVTKSLPVSRQDEIGILARSFQRMIKTLTAQKADLHKSEAKNRAILDCAADAVITVDGNGQVESNNLAAGEMFGYRENEMVGESINSLLSERTAKIFQRYIGNHIMVGNKKINNIGANEQGKKKDGTNFPIHLSISEVRFDHKFLFTAIIRDTSDDKKKEHALKTFNAKYQSIFDQSPYSIMTLSPSGFMITVNKTWKKMWGDKACRTPGYNVFQDQTIIKLGLLPYFKKGFSGNSTVIPARNFQVRKDGVSDGWVSSWVRGLIYPVTDNDGNIMEVILMQEDITEQKEIEDKIIQLRHQNELVLQSIGEGVYSVDNDGLVTFVNSAAARMTGWMPQDLIGHKLHDLLHAHQGDLADASDCPLCQGETEDIILETSEHRFWKKDGESFAVEMTRTPIKEDNKVIGTVVAFRDITKQNEIVQSLEKVKNNALEASKIKAEFLANMSHEIRTPMNGILGMLTLLADTELSGEQQDYVTTASNSGNALLKLINNILDLSKVEADKLEIEYIDFDIRALVEEILQLYADQSQRKAVEIGCLIDDSIPTLVRCDPTRLRQILTNLISNALKFTDNGEVIVSLYAEEGSNDIHKLRFMVCDTGIGIKEEAKDQIFESFTQADGSTTRKYGGTGLGLSICQQLVQLMGGNINVQSTVGEGSMFSFDVRYYESLEKEKPIVLPPQLKASRLLVVDDNAVNQMVMQHMLARWNISHDNAADDGLALEKLHDAVDQGKPFNLVVINLEMNETDSIKLIQNIRTDKAVQDVQIIASVSLGRKTNHREMAGKEGVDVFLTKPIRREQLFSTLTGLFGDGVESDAGDYSDKFSILLAEDNEVNQKVLVGMLQQTGHEVVVVNNGVQALNATTDRDFDMVFMDCQMPVMDGYEATKSIREREEGEGKRIPIIAMTAHDKSESEEKCLACGMDDFISKPFNPDGLDTIMKKWLKKEQPDEELESEVVLFDVDLFDEEPEKTIETLDEVVFLQLKELMGDSFPELVETYLSDSHLKTEFISVAYREHDADKLIESLHSLKGSSLNIGALKLSSICEELEIMAKSAEMNDDILSVIAQLGEELVLLKTAMDNYMHKKTA